MALSLPPKYFTTSDVRVQQKNLEESHFTLFWCLPTEALGYLEMEKDKGKGRQTGWMAHYQYKKNSTSQGDIPIHDCRIKEVC